MGESVGPHTDDVPGFRLRGTLWAGTGRRLHRAEALGDPGRPLMLEVHDLEPEQETLEELRRQTGVIRALEHPGLLPVREIVAAQGGVALVMPAVSGGSLEEALDGPSGALLSTETFDAITTALRDAVAVAHASGVHHGALSASQVHFDAGGQPTILGFGSAVLWGTAASSEDAFEMDRRALEQLLEVCRSRTRTPAAVPGDPTRDTGSPPSPADPREAPHRHDDHERTEAPGDSAVRYGPVLAAVVVLVTPVLLAGVSLLLN